MPEKMMAVVKTKPQVGAEWLEVDVPKLKPDWVLVKVKATSICGTDVHIWKWDPWSEGRIGSKKLPQTMGHEVAGEVVEVGNACKRIKVGDSISAETHIYDPADLTSLLGVFHVGKNMKILGVDTDGAFAEYFLVPESVCWPNDKSIPPELATIQEPLGNATYAVLGEDNDVAGKTMLITGDGPISLFATGVARSCGVAKIIVFGKYDFNMDIAKKMGADHLIYTNKTTPEERFKFVMDHTEGFGVDIALEMVGSQDSIDDCFKMVRKAGRVSAFGIPGSSPLPVDYANGMVFKGCQVHAINGRKIFDTWYRNRNLLANLRLDPKPVITHLFALEDYAKGFEAMTTRPRASAKVVLFPDKKELEAAKKRMGMI
jgi:threonine 3-dehydrogenase